MNGDSAQNIDLIDTNLIFEEAEFDAAWDYAFSELALTDDSEQNKKILKGRSEANFLMFIVEAFNNNARCSSTGWMDDGFGVIKLVFARIENLLKKYPCDRANIEEYASELYGEDEAHKEIYG